MRQALTIIGIAAATAFTGAPAASAAGDYATAPFAATTNAYTFGQAPVFMPDGRVVFGRDFGNGTQVYMAGQDGSRLHCLTCELPAPNNVPAVRPDGSWILFHSWNGHHFTLGSPGYGGIGSELYVMRPDGSGVTKLTGTSAANGSGEGEDDYHAYWSPDGRQIVWAHLNWNFVDDSGQGKWDVRVADFVDDGRGPPHLANVRVVRPANGHWYETQWWAPDGSGFLYTETWGTAMNPELFFCRLTSAGCQVTRLTYNSAWDEQALFTPDMKDVIFMSTRDHPGFFNTFSSLAQDAGLTTDEDYLLTLPVFEAGFLQPVAQEATDLYELDLATGAVRRLTTEGDDGWIIPEFAWDPTNRFLMWTEQRYPDGYRVPFPLDPAGELRQTAQLLRNPPKPNPRNQNLLSPVPLEARTEIGRFAGEAPYAARTATCAASPKLRLALRRRRGTRIVAVQVFVNGHRVLRRRARSLRSVTIVRPRTTLFTVRIVARRSDGRRLVTRRVLRGCA